MADADRYLGPVRDMEGAALKATFANDLLVQSVADLNDALRGTAGSAAGATGSLGDLKARASDVRTALGGASTAAGGFSRSLGNLGDRVRGVVIPSLMLLDAELDRKIAALGGAAGAAGLLSGAMKANAASTVIAGGATQRTTRFWWLGANALHWLVMGTLELASTAIPAIVAFGGAVAGMAPTFIHISDQMNFLRIATGSWKAAMLNSVGPLHNLGVGMGNLSRAMAPDAYIIFGSVINGLSGHFGVFSKMAQQAGIVLANFATKLSAELSGPLGNQLTLFFANAVKYMIQWGQVLGSLSHAFLNVMNSMWGVGHLVLDVLNMISRAFLAISSNPFGRFLIGLLTAISALYRFAGVALWVARLLGFQAATASLRVVISTLASMIPILLSIRSLEDAVAAGELLMESAAGPVLIAMAAIAGALGVWWLMTRRSADATSVLIGHVRAAKPTFTNLTQGIMTLAHAAGAASVSLHGGTLGIDRFGRQAQILGHQDIPALAAAMRQQVHELVNLETALSQVHLRSGAVGAGMAAMAIQTALADSKVAQLNQALDAYMGILTGGTSGVAQFEQSLANIGVVAGTTANNLGTATGTMNLSAAQFSRALSSYMGKGAGAWTNFDQVIGSTMPSLTDWFRQASTLGATTGPAVAKAALDMAAAMMKYAGSNRTARAEVLGFLRAQGENFRSWGALKKAVHDQGAGQADLKKKIDGTTISLSQLSEMAKNAGAALNTQMSTAIANSALQASGFNTDMKNAMQSVNTGMPVAGHTAQYWFNLAGQAGIKAGKMAAQGAGAMTKAGDQMARGAHTAQGAFKSTLDEARQLQTFLDAMHGTTLHVNTVYTSSGSSTPPGHMAGPGSGPNAAGPGVVIHNHFHGSVLSGQEVGRVLQGSLNRKTIRNGSTQLYIRSRQH